jgi:hypothetical protein
MPSPSGFYRFLLTGLLAVGFASAWAAEGSTSVSPGMVSAYVFRGQHRGGAALQTAVDVVRGDFAAGLWTSFPLEGSGALSPGTEVDFYAGQNLRAGGAFVVTPGATLYTYPRAERALGFRRTTLEPSLAISGALAGVRVVPKLSHDLDLKATTLEVAAAYALALPALGTELDFHAAVGTYRRRDDVPRVLGAGKAWGDYWQIGVSLPYQVSFRTKLVVGWTYAAGSGAFVKSGSAPRLPDPRTAGRGFASLGLSTTF